MTQFTLDDLRRLLREAAGEDDTVQLDGDIADVPFADLGYDSVALLETAAAADREFGATIPDELLGELTTPAAFVKAVRELLPQT
ncbi:acyl carrier protein [Amycolatopsis sp. NPDC059090]|uniref:acyl carrier protein n=1 Tax=unclassified Amycolatopsis TaxID=2618356 RepID=UPI00366DCAC3